MMNNRKIILIMLSVLSVGISGCGMPGPLYETPEEVTTDAEKTPVDKGES